MINQSSTLMRGTIIILLFVALGLLLVGAGTLSDSSKNYYPGNQELENNPESYIGDQVTISGTVIETDPIIIEAFGTGSFELKLYNFNDPVKVGDHVSIFGTYQGNNEISVEQSLIRESWEMQYMYIVSFLGGLWVLIRLIRHWQIDRECLAFVPRSDRDA